MLAAELASLRIVPGNESHRYAKTIVDMVHKFDAMDADVTEQIAADGADIDELLRNDKAMMQGIVSLSKLVTSMHDTLKRYMDALYDDGYKNVTETLEGGSSVGRKDETVTS